MNEKHLSQLESYLDQQGLTFKPLKEEMLDHMAGDIESYMKSGKSFDEAWLIVTEDIPDGHFKKIQQDTIEVINKRVNLSKWLTYLSLFLIFAASAFKTLHWPGSGGLLLSGIGAMACSLLAGTFTGIYLHKEKKGKLMVLGTVLAIILFLISWGFEILQFPGVLLLRGSSIIILMILFPFLTLYFNSKKRNRENLLLYLHEKHTPGIERIFLFFLATSVLLRIASVIFEYPPAVAQVLQIFVIGGAGLQFFALNWHTRPNTKSKVCTIMLLVAFPCFILPTLGNAIFSFNTRVIMVAGFYLISGLVLLFKAHSPNYKKVAVPVVIWVSVFYLIWTLISIDVISLSLNYIIFNLPVVLLLILGLIFSFKHPLLKTYMIMVIAHYLFEFPAQFALF